MKFLIDRSPKDVLRKLEKYPELIAGQLLTPLTRFRNAGALFAIDNGAFSGFDRASFASLLRREEANRDRCLFVTVPDVVASARRTLEIWQRRQEFLRGWKLALVAQDGIEDLDIPWESLSTIFIGGGDPWKDSKSAIDVVRTAKILGKSVHVGRVNTAKRYRLFLRAGADTCDGSGVALYDHMIEAIQNDLKERDRPGLFDLSDTGAER